MRIGKQDQPFTAIATADAETITVRGRDLCRDLIGKIGFTDYFYLLLTGEVPTEDQRFFVDAVLVAIAEHGLVPSVQAARMTLAAGPEAWQGAVAAGLLGAGSVVLGSSEVAGRLLASLVERAARENRPEAEVAREALADLKAAGRRIPGLGHPQHSAGDPRSDRLLQLADQRGTARAHVRMLRVLEAEVPGVIGHPLPINVSGAIPAVVLDVGYPLGALKGLPLLARTAGLIAHLYEETQRPIGFIMSNHADRAITYDGPKAEPEG